MARGKAWLGPLSFPQPREKDLKRLPRDRQARIKHAIDEMEENPFVGDVKALKGPEWKGRYRKRVEPHRIIFKVDREITAVAISGHFPSVRTDLSMICHAARPPASTLNHRAASTNRARRSSMSERPASVMIT